MPGCLVCIKLPSTQQNALALRSHAWADDVSETFVCPLKTGVSAIGAALLVAVAGWVIQVATAKEGEDIDYSANPLLPCSYCSFVLGVVLIVAGILLVLLVALLSALVAVVVCIAAVVLAPYAANMCARAVLHTESTPFPVNSVLLR